MSKPFFIWTLRRTGGTSLTTLLAEISEYPKIDDEPFNEDRVLNYIVQDFKSGNDIANELSRVFSSTPNVKYCYEPYNEEFNSLIVNVASNQNYKHIILTREDEVSRIMSLFLAQQTNVWGAKNLKKYKAIKAGEESLCPFNIDKMLNQYKHDRKITNDIKEMLTKKNKQYKVVSFEDIYTGNRKKRLTNLQELFEFLEFNENTMAEFEDKIEEMVFHASQDTKNILKYVPNHLEAVEKLTNISNTSWQSKIYSIIYSLQYTYKSFKRFVGKIYRKVLFKNAK